ncbi:MAG: 1-(5-phosphoribosyl)-5-amino-4-imidazole-carboxylate carboxylase [Planctomycetaceae bacterium]|nr:1-(5-phosphoribosyl)-5-amino-4-imidazole-carboxylate carboxylase [Planctomycetaceae bacterium]
MADYLSDILNQLQRGEVSVDEAAARLRDRAAEPLGFATLDHHRDRRCGIPEVIYAAGKLPQQVVKIAQAMVARTRYALITRAEPAHADALDGAFDQVEGGTRRRTLIVGEPPELTGDAVPIITAGTSDDPVAEEAGLTFRALGQPSKRITDVGVAGLHRLLQRMDDLKSARVIVCIAGMEGALPSVVGGLVDVPVIAVPTSVGYGAALNGVAALLGMLTSCAAGVTVVNIDNGFGAAYTATLIQRQQESDGEG